MLWLTLTAHIPSATALLAPVDVSQRPLSPLVTVQSSPHAGAPLWIEPGAAPYGSRLQTTRQVKERRGPGCPFSLADGERARPRPSPVVVTAKGPPWRVWSPQALAPPPSDEPPLS